MRCATWKCFKLAVWLVVEHLSRGKCEVNGYCEECLNEISEGKIIKKWKIDEDSRIDTP